MTTLTKITQTFPSVRIPSQHGGLDVEVSLISQLGHGAGNHLFNSALARQQAHHDFVDELDEPSAKLASTNFDKNDPTALYSFAVGAKGHPFHRHAGHRIFTAISGSGGAQLRFSSATDLQFAEDPYHFIKHLHYINIPPDCLFTVRFGGETWHQFAPLFKNSPHPVFFALSCHTNELGGNLSPELKQKVLANEADIPSLTELLPQDVINLLQSDAFSPQDIPTSDLSLDAPPGTLQRAVCKSVRCASGLLRGTWAKWRTPKGYLSRLRQIKTHTIATPNGSLLHQEFASEKVHYDDTHCISLPSQHFNKLNAVDILELILQGFLENRPKFVSKLMTFRNALVKPMGLRTSPLGCPVSSLLNKDCTNLFANCYPVLQQQIDETKQRAQVVLGANDKHLNFRTCIGVEIKADHQIHITLSTKVQCKNWFGRFYMSIVNIADKYYISPALLRMALESTLNKLHDESTKPLTHTTPTTHQISNA